MTLNKIKYKLNKIKILKKRVLLKLNRMKKIIGLVVIFKT